MQVLAACSWVVAVGFLSHAFAMPQATSMDLRTTKSIYQAGEQIHLIYSITNNGSKPSLVPADIGYVIKPYSSYTELIVDGPPGMILKQQGIAADPNTNRVTNAGFNYDDNGNVTADATNTYS